MSKKTTAYARRRGLHKLSPAQRRQAARSNAYANELAAFRLINELQPFAAEEVAKLSVPPLVAYEKIRTGKGCAEDFDTLAAVVNVALVRCEQIGQEGVDLCIDAQEALMIMRERQRRTGRWGVDAMAIKTIPPAIDLHEDLLRLSTPQQMRQALQEVLNRCEREIFHWVETGNTEGQRAP